MCQPSCALVITSEIGLLKAELHIDVKWGCTYGVNLAVLDRYGRPLNAKATVYDRHIGEDPVKVLLGNGDTCIV